MNALSNFFQRLLGCCLVLSALAKFIGLLHGPKILFAVDPILSIPNWMLYLLAGLGEVIAAFYLIAGSNQSAKLLLVAVLSSNFIAYQTAHNVLKVQEPCPCFGRITDWIPSVKQYIPVFHGVLFLLMAVVAIDIVGRLILYRQQIRTVRS